MFDRALDRLAYGGNRDMLLLRAGGVGVLNQLATAGDQFLKHAGIVAYRPQAAKRVGILPAKISQHPGIEPIGLGQNPA